MIPFTDILQGKTFVQAFDGRKLVFTAVLDFVMGWGTHIVCLMCIGVLVCSFICLFVRKELERESIVAYLLVLIPLLVGAGFLWLAPSNALRGKRMGSELTGWSLATFKTSFSHLIQISFLTNYNVHLFLIAACIVVASRYLNKPLTIILILLFVPLALILLTRNEWLYWELPTRVVSLIYPTLIDGGASVYEGVSWNLPFYFYGFYTVLYIATVFYCFLKDPRRNALLAILFAAGVCGNISRFMAPIGSERTCIYSDYLFMICFLLACGEWSVKIPQVVLLLCLAASVFVSFNDFQVYFRDHEVYERRVAILKGCAEDAACDFAELPAYLAKVYFDDSHPGSGHSKHSDLVVAYYGIADYAEYH